MLIQRGAHGVSQTLKACSHAQAQTKYLNWVYEMCVLYSNTSTNLLPKECDIKSTKIRSNECDKLPGMQIQGLNCNQQSNLRGIEQTRMHAQMCCIWQCLLARWLSSVRYSRRSSVSRLHFMIMDRCGSHCSMTLVPCVTAKMATPTKVDSKLSDAHLESLKRREGEGKCH